MPAPPWKGKHHTCFSLPWEVAIEIPEAPITQGHKWKWWLHLACPAATTLNPCTPNNGGCTPAQHSNQSLTLPGLPDKRWHLLFLRIPKYDEGSTSGRAGGPEMVSSVPECYSFFLCEVEKIILCCPERSPGVGGCGEIHGP